MRVRLSPRTFIDLDRLLSLDDQNLAQHKAGKLIRNDFKRRGWLKGGRRGKPYTRADGKYRRGDSGSSY